MAALRKATRHPETHGYCLHSCTRPLREAAAAWFGRRYQGELDPEQNILALIGSQEGLGHLLLALTDPGDLILITSFGSGAGSDSFVLRATERLPQRRELAATVRSMLDGPRQYLTYGEYAKVREKIIVNE